jgi:hypothetical protein
MIVKCNKFETPVGKAKKCQLMTICVQYSLNYLLFILPSLFSNGSVLTRVVRTFKVLARVVRTFKVGIL